ncbi:unnamed protein product [Auanema sp. JU1783]|nr:unnamed protein product [Auanema sp. JU1783]
MATLVASVGGGEANANASSGGASTPSSSSSSSRATQNSMSPSSSNNGVSNGTTSGSPNRSKFKVERLADEEEVITFLMEYFVTSEPILSSLNINNRNELRTLLTDVIRDCLPCPASCGTRDDQGRLTGVCLASRSTLFEKQMDRLCLYKFEDEKMRIAVEFLKYVFNRVDVIYHCEEHHIARPIFIALVSVRPDCEHSGIGTGMLQYCVRAGASDQADGALMLCSSNNAFQIVNRKFLPTNSWTISRIRYADYRGEYREPPIVPQTESDNTLYVLLTKFVR